MFCIGLCSVNINMKKLIQFTLLSISSAFSLAHAADSSQLQKLEPETITAESTHLTTRIEWTQFPRIQYNSSELSGQNRSAIIRVKANKQGHVTDADIQESTGVKALDQKLIRAVEQAEVKPHQENGNKKSIVGYQTFTLRLKDATDQTQSNAVCKYSFNSEVWHRQSKDKSTAFKYSQQPSLSLDQTLLKFKDRTVKFKFKVNKQGEVTQVKLKKLSGVNAIDQAVYNALSNSKVELKRTASTLWMYKKHTLKDEIQFTMDDCH